MTLEVSRYKCIEQSAFITIEVPSASGPYVNLLLDLFVGLFKFISHKLVVHLVCMFTKCWLVDPN